MEIKNKVVFVAALLMAIAGSSVFAVNQDTQKKEIVKEQEEQAAKVKNSKVVSALAAAGGAASFYLRPQLYNQISVVLGSRVSLGNLYSYYGFYTLGALLGLSLERWYHYYQKSAALETDNVDLKEQRSKFSELLAKAQALIKVLQGKVKSEVAA